MNQSSWESPNAARRQRPLLAAARLPRETVLSARRSVTTNNRAIDEIVMLIRLSRTMPILPVN